MECFYGDAPLDSMRHLLADDLEFEGPFYKFNSAKDYLECLKVNPPSEAKYKMLQVYEGGDSVCLVYIFTKPGVETLMAQTFEVANGKIGRIRLIFDTKAFDKQ